MKYVVYYKEGDLPYPYVVYTIHEGEHYVVWPSGLKVHGRTDSPHIIVRRDDTNDQVDILTGRFEEEFTDDRQARKHASKMNGVFRVMES